MESLDNIQVTDRNSFISFLELLQQDLKNNQQAWENIDLESFLEAMAAYAQDIQGFYDNTRQNVNADIPSWRVFADILMGARIYE